MPLSGSRSRQRGNRLLPLAFRPSISWPFGPHAIKSLARGRIGVLQNQIHPIATYGRRKRRPRAKISRAFEDINPITAAKEFHLPHTVAKRSPCFTDGQRRRGNDQVIYIASRENRPGILRVLARVAVDAYRYLI